MILIPTEYIYVFTFSKTGVKIPLTFGWTDFQYKEPLITNQF